MEAFDMKKIVLGLAMLAAAAFVPACSSEDPIVATDTAVTNVKVSSNQFEPAQVKVKVGDTVRWTWTGGSHNVVSGPDCATDDGKFKSGAPVAGGTFDKKFETAGTFPYYCQPHCGMGMKGEVIVE
jgi:plastocyanin